MKKIIPKISLAITVVSFSTQAKAVDYHYFIKTIKQSCEKSNSLLLKKTFLSFMRDKNSCENTFAQKLLNDCEKLSCQKLKTTFETSNQRESGNVIGRSY